MWWNPFLFSYYTIPLRESRDRFNIKGAHWVILGPLPLRLTIWEMGVGRELSSSLAFGECTIHFLKAANFLGMQKLSSKRLFHTFQRGMRMQWTTMMSNRTYLQICITDVNLNWGMYQWMDGSPAYIAVFMWKSLLSGLIAAHLPQLHIVNYCV